MSMSWADVAPTRPANPSDPTDPAYVWPAEIDRAIVGARRGGYGCRCCSRALRAGPTAAAPRSGPRTTRPTSPTLPPRHRAATRASRHWMIWGEPSKPSRFQPLAERDRPAPQRSPAPWTAPLRAHPRRVLRRSEEGRSAQTWSSAATPGPPARSCRSTSSGRCACRMGAGRAWISTGTTRSRRGSRTFARIRSATARPTSPISTRSPAGSTATATATARAAPAAVPLGAHRSRPTTRTIEFNFWVTPGHPGAMARRRAADRTALGADLHARLPRALRRPSTAGRARGQPRAASRYSGKKKPAYSRLPARMMLTLSVRIDTAGADRVE